MIQDTWSQFETLLNDYHYMRQNGIQYNNIDNSNSNSNIDSNDNKENELNSIFNEPPKKKRKINESDPLGFNEEKFTNILKDGSLHAKMANIIQDQYSKKCDPTNTIQQILNMDQCPFDDLFIPLPPTNDIETNPSNDIDTNPTNNDNTNNSLK